MRENELKSKECHEAQTSLRELQMELMRKSMHVGSLGKENLSLTIAPNTVSTSFIITDKRKNELVSVLLIVTTRIRLSLSITSVF
jgi:hypothetical protein